MLVLVTGLIWNDQQKTLAVQHRPPSSPTAYPMMLDDFLLEHRYLPWRLRGRGCISPVVGDEYEHLLTGCTAVVRCIDQDDNVVLQMCHKLRYIHTAEFLYENWRPLRRLSAWQRLSTGDF